MFKSLAACSFNFEDSFILDALFDEHLLAYIFGDEAATMALGAVALIAFPITACTLHPLPFHSIIDLAFATTAKTCSKLFIFTCWTCTLHGV